MDEKGFDANSRCVVALNPRYFRPTEVETLLGDPTKAQEKLGWRPSATKVKRHGYSGYDSHE